MKSWFRKIKLEDCDVLLQMHYDDQESEEAPYRLDVKIPIDGCLQNASMGFGSYEDLENAFNKFTKDHVENIYNEILTLYQD